VLGDFNSGTKLRGRRSVSAGHQKIVKTCSDLGLVSAYHAFNQVEHAREKHATYYHQFKSTQPWHIDYCFVPTAWSKGLMNVRVVNGRIWADHSDHRPLIVDLVPQTSAEIFFSPFFPTPQPPHPPVAPRGAERRQSARSRARLPRSAPAQSLRAPGIVFAP